MDRAHGSSESVGPLLHALAESLDVREIFARISAEGLEEPGADCLSDNHCFFRLSWPKNSS